MATKTQATGRIFSSLRHDIAQLDRAHLAFFVRDVFRHDRVPDRLDLLAGQDAVGHDFRGPQLVAPMDQINLRSEAGEEERFLRRGIAAADHADRHVAIKCAIAGRATRQAVADQLLFVLQPEVAGGGAAGDDQRLRLEPFVIGLEADMPAAPVRSRSPPRRKNARRNFSACACMFMISCGPSMPSGKPGKFSTKVVVES